MQDRLGSIMMSDEEVLIMPEIPVRPNPSIPVAAAVIMILGGLLVGYAAYNAFFADELFSPTDESQLAQQFTDADPSANITQEDIAEYDSNFSTSNYNDWNGVLFLCSALFLITGGALLYVGQRRGVYLSIFGAVLLTTTNIWGSNASLEAATHLPEFASLTFATMYYIYACCGLFCISSAILPLLFASSRAALDREKFTVVNPSSTEYKFGSNSEEE
ncbi:MAG: hypothetical protein VYC11_00045 [Candidatus Thermoplasmatota archaeon]|jgi:hypothetical protein|nr:hypothetical protein [Candidatus Thermoplasmatota archaeon]